jgi:ATP-dependent DNA ligase
MTVRLAMNYTEIEIGKVDDLIADPEVVFEQKLDGTRVLAVVTHDHVRYLQRGGQTLGHTAATQWLGPITEALQPLRLALEPGDEVVLDGELLTGNGQYHLFDLPYAVIKGQNWSSPLELQHVRRGVLEDLALRFDPPVHLVRQARNSDEKRLLVEEVRGVGGEGFMAKRLNSLYLSGQRTKDQVKVKFTSTVDVVVMEVNRPDPKHGSATVGVYNAESTLVKVGATSLIGKPVVVPGDVIECTILYWTGESLYQPRMMRVRDDKPARDCTFEQFKPYSRMVV